MVLLPARLLDGIAGGRIDLAFRSWRRPSVRAGGTLRTPVGVLAIDAVDPIDPAAITDREAQRAGAADAEEVRAGLRLDAGRTVYRIAFHRAGDDPRVALREAADLSIEDVAAIAGRLDAIDRRSRRGAWTRELLALIAARPGTRAPDLAALVGRDVRPFKADVRRLKELGLTESLRVGYRLSPRGRAFVEATASASGPSRASP